MQSATRWFTSTLRGAAVTIPLVAVVALAGCGSDDQGSSSSPDPATDQAATIATDSGAPGTYLTGADGRAVYLWLADKGSESTCTGACASAWPPVLTSGTPVADGDAKSSELGTTERSDGGTQVTYRGHPLYYYKGDTEAGQTSGQGSNGFGATWWLVEPSGVAITDTATPSSSSMGGGYGY